MWIIMKCLLFLSSLLALSTAIDEFIRKYNILHDVLNNLSDELILINGTDSFGAYKLGEDKVISISLDQFKTPLDKLVPPFEIFAKVQLTEDETSFLFSISEEGKTKLAIHLTPAGPLTVRVSLDSELRPKGHGSYLHSMSENEEWTTMIIQVEKEKINFYIDCELQGTEKLTENFEELYFPQSSKLYLGKFGEEDKKLFRGGIQNLEILPNPKYYGYDNICNSTVHSSASSVEYLTPPANLVAAFIKDDHERGDTTLEDYSSPTEGESDNNGSEDFSLKGDKGVKGDPGESITGPEGPRGPPGDIGPRGPKGEEGSCKCTEAVVSSLLRGMPEMRGAPGEPGPRGEKGDVGLTETEGAKEKVVAEKGETGAIGPMGPVGPAGPIGPPGGFGNKGEKGAQGIKGEKGEEIIHKGIDGQPGPRGEKGETGSPGDIGQPGTHGLHGEKGDRGAKGDKGDLGAPGAPARLSSLLDDDMDINEYGAIVARFKGGKGDTGESGPRGDRGDMGPIGPIGPPGVDGPTGPEGERGHKGHKGDPGPEGSKGGKGEPGQPGLPGNVPESAISLMKGPKGEPGLQGKTGDRGASGHPGKKGPVGPAGSKGSKGEPGQRGAQGATGAKGGTGKPGPRGEKGETPYIDVEKLKGEKGSRGDTGSPGAPGIAGPPGTCTGSNVTGVPGPPGPRGPPGSPGLAVTGPKGEPGGMITRDTMFVYNEGPSSSEDDDFYTAATMVFKSSSALFKRTPITPQGTLAYVLEEKIMLMRVEEGWQYVVMGSIIRTSDTYTSTRRPSMYYTTSSEMPMRDAPLEDKYIRLVALNEPFTGNMLTAQNRTGRNAANQECYKQALQARQKSTFVAFLANKIEDLRSLVKRNRDKNAPIVNIHNEVLFDSWSTMFNGSGAVFVNANIYSFNGKNVLTENHWETKAVWHGSNLFGIRTPRAFCEEWQSDSPLHYGHASSLRSSKLLDQERYSCDKKLIVLCVEATTTAHRIRQRHSNRYSRHFQRAKTPLDNRIPNT